MEGLPRSVQKRNFRVLIISTVLISFFFGMQTNTLPLYILELGGTAAHVGMLAGIASIVALFFRVIMGHLIDKKGRRIVYSAGIGMYIVATLGYIFVPSIYAVLFFRAVGGIGLCAVTSSLGAILADLMPENLTKGFYTIAVSQIAGALFAPTIGIFTGNMIGYKVLYIITGVGLTTSFIMSMSLSYEKHMSITTKNDNPSEDTYKGIKKLIETTALIPAVCMIFHGLAMSSVIGFVAVYGKTINIENIGFFFIINGLTSFAIRPFLSRFSEDRSRNMIFLIGSVFFIGTMVLFIFSINPIWIGLSAITYAIAYFATQPILNSLALQKAPTHRKGAANSTYYIFWDIGYGFGSAMLGMVAARSGYISIYLIGIVAVIILYAIYVKFLSYKRESLLYVENE